MKKIVAYGLMGMIALVIIASTVVLGGRDSLYAVYNPVANKNVAVSKVTMDQIQAWVSYPSFKRWTDMDALETYLAERGVDLDDLLRASDKLDNNERNKLYGAHERTKGLDERDTLNTFGSNVRETLSGIEQDALTDFECDFESNTFPNGGEVEFKITNTGSLNWFLVDQELTTGLTRNGRKYLSEVNVEAPAVDLWINNFLVTSKIPKFWMGQKLYYDHGENFADSCKADFVRVGKSVECELNPVPLRSGFLTNHYMLVTPDFVERGTFTCS